MRRQKLRESIMRCGGRKIERDGMGAEKSDKHGRVRVRTGVMEQKKSKRLKMVGVRGESKGRKYGIAALQVLSGFPLLYSNSEKVKQ